MALATSTILAAAALATTAYSAMEARDAKKDAQKDRERAFEQQKLAQSEEKAANAATMAQDRRKSIREERIRRAQIIAASSNTGVGESSGVSGASGSLSTQLGTNIGFSRGMERIGGNISQFNQNAAAFMSSSQNHLNRADNWGQIGSLSMSIFNASGGFGAFNTGGMPAPQQAAAPVSTASTRSLY